MIYEHLTLVKPIEEGLQDQKAYPPLGLLYLASYVKLYGAIRPDKVNLLFMDDGDDYTCCIPNLYEAAQKNNSIIGISMHSPGAYTEAKKCIDFILEEKKDRDILILVGGAFATSCYDMILNEYKNPSIWVVRGEGEKALVEITHGGQPVEVPGVYAWEFGREVDFVGEQGGGIIGQGFAESISDLDNLPYPDRGMLREDVHYYTGNTHHSGGIVSTTIIATRGCPFSCAFCDKAIYGRKWRCRSVENICEEIFQANKQAHREGRHIGWWRFIDDNMLANKVWFNNLCKGLSKLDIEWTCLARAEDIDIGTLKNMKKAGCKEIFFGIESGSQELLDKMNKKSTVEHNKRAIDLCKKVGIKSCAYMIFGFPGENYKTVDETIAFLKDAKPDKSRITQFLPVPGSAVYEKPEEFGVEFFFNPDTFWYFDNDNFPINYKYIGNSVMLTLKEKINKAYEEMGYKDGWTK